MEQLDSSWNPRVLLQVVSSEGFAPIAVVATDVAVAVGVVVATAIEVASSLLLLIVVRSRREQESKRKLKEDPVRNRLELLFDPIPEEFRKVLQLLS